MGWQMFTKQYRLELESHHHDTDEYLFFLGATLPDLVGSFDGEIEYFMGEEYERHVITEATVLYIYEKLDPLYDRLNLEKKKANPDQELIGEPSGSLNSDRSVSKEYGHV